MKLNRSRSLNIPALRPPPINAHYEGEYSDRMMRWRRLCAIDKSQNILDLLDRRADEIGSVLEAGCGTGAVLAELSKHLSAQKFVGVDLTDPDEHADPAVARSGVGLVRSESDTLPFDDDSFDLVYASHVLEHVEDERGFLQELARVARYYVYVEVPCELTIMSSPASIQHTLTTVGHINSFTPQSLALTLATSGLEMIDLKVFDHSEAIQQFDTSAIKGKLKWLIRSGLLNLNPQLATKILSYHAGALCDVRSQDT